MWWQNKVLCVELRPWQSFVGSCNIAVCSDWVMTYLPTHVFCYPHLRSFIMLSLQFLSGSQIVAPHFVPLAFLFVITHEGKSNVASLERSRFTGTAAKQRASKTRYGVMVACIIVAPAHIQYRASSCCGGSCTVRYEYCETFL